MTDKAHVKEFLEDLRAADEINYLVYELLINRIDSIAERYAKYGSEDFAVTEELLDLDMAPSYIEYGTSMMPLSQQDALKRYDSGEAVYLIYEDNTEALCENRNDIASSDTHYAYEVNEPVSLLSIIPQGQPQAPKMVYIASPLRGDYNQNIENAVTYCKNACNLGALALAPHIIFSQWCNDTIPEQREQGLKLGIALLSKSEELWVMGEHISEGMRGEIEFAKEYNIPTYYVSQPHDIEHYPISTDKYQLLSTHSCIDGSMDADLTSCLVVMQHEMLSPDHRKPINQLWLATHGPGCHTNSFTGTVHLTHPVDGDKICVGRHELCGVASRETIEHMKACYPQLATMMQPKQATEQDEEMCR